MITLKLIDSIECAAHEKNKRRHSVNSVRVHIYDVYIRICKKCINCLCDNGLLWLSDPWLITPHRCWVSVHFFSLVEIFSLLQIRARANQSHIISDIDWKICNINIFIQDLFAFTFVIYFNIFNGTFLYFLFSFFFTQLSHWMLFDTLIILLTI